MAYPMEKSDAQKVESLNKAEKKLIKAREVALEHIQIAERDLELVEQYLVEIREKKRKAGIVVENG